MHAIIFVSTLMLLSIRQNNAFCPGATLARQGTAPSTDTNKLMNTNVSFPGNTHTALLVRKESIETGAANPKIISIGYGSLALAYITQIGMAMNKSAGLYLHSAIGGPVMAAVLSLILVCGGLNDSKSDASSKLMNGSLMIYSSLCLVLVGLAPQLNTQFGQLYFASSLLTFMINAKGYSGDLSLKGFVSETKSLLARIHDANIYTYKNARDVPNFFYLVGMLAVVLMKTDVVLPIIFDPFSFPKRVFAYKVSTLAKLCVVGGSLVTLRDATNQKILKQGRFRVLNISVAYVFGSLAGK